MEKIKSKVGRKVLGKRYVQVRMKQSYTADEIDFVRTYIEEHIDNVVTLRRENERLEAKHFIDAQNVQKIMQQQHPKPQTRTVQVFVNMTMQKHTELSSEQHAKIHAAAPADLFMPTQIPNNRKSTKTRVDFVLDKAKNASQIYGTNDLKIVIGYPQNSPYEKVCLELAAEITARLSERSIPCIAVAL